jgi:hypothetical protein
MEYEQWVNCYGDKLEELFYNIQNYVNDDLDESHILDMCTIDHFYLFMYQNSRDTLF